MFSLATARATVPVHTCILPACALFSASAASRWAGGLLNYLPSAATKAAGLRQAEPPLAAVTPTTTKTRKIYKKKSERKVPPPMPVDQSKLSGRQTKMAMRAWRLMAELQEMHNLTDQQRAAVVAVWRVTRKRVVKLNPHSSPRNRLAWLNQATMDRIIQEWPVPKSLDIDEEHRNYALVALIRLTLVKGEVLSYGDDGFALVHTMVGMSKLPVCIKLSHIGGIVNLKPADPLTPKNLSPSERFWNGMGNLILPTRSDEE